MAQVRPNDLALRCYGYRQQNGWWFGVCLDLSISTEASSFEELKQKINEMINSYILVVLDTRDHESVPALLSRKAPLIDWLKYYCIKAEATIRKIPDRFIFKNTIPFYLGHGC